MALTVAARGTGTHNASATTFTLSPASNLAAGSWAVLVISADNAHTGGTAFTTFTVTDDKANIWTRRVGPLYDPGAANAGVEGAQFTTDMAGGTLLSSTVITVTFDTAATAKAWVMWEVVPAAGKVVSAGGAIPNGVSAGAATTTPTVTTDVLTSADVLIGALHNEYGTAQTVTADADSSNGSWSAQQLAKIGTTAAGMTVASQVKVVTATATQTYNPTLGTSSNVILSWIALFEIPLLSVGGVDQTANLLLGSLTLRFNTFDFALVDPTSMPILSATVALGNPIWNGHVTSIRVTDLLRTDTNLVTITATNTDVASASTGPFGLSDAPDNVTTFGYRDMATTLTKNMDLVTTTAGVCTIFHAGLWPAMTFPLTSANRSYSAQSFTVTNVTVTWPKLTNPVFRIEFGDQPMTLGAWTTAQAVFTPASTRIRYDPQGALARRTTTQSIANATWTAISLDASEDFDPFGFHDTASNPSRFTVPTGWSGTYLLTGNSGITSGAGTVVQCGWALNGANPTLAASTYYTPIGTGQTVSSTVVQELSAGDYVELMVLHNQGGAQNTLGNDYAAIMYLGELV